MAMPQEATVQKGTVSYTVKGLQYMLNQQGHNLAIDGVFGVATEAAVKAFQAEHHLLVDGIVADKTWAALSLYCIYQRA